MNSTEMIEPGTRSQSKTISILIVMPAILFIVVFSLSTMESRDSWVQIRKEYAIACGPVNWISVNSLINHLKLNGNANEYAVAPVISGNNGAWTELQAIGELVPVNTGSGNSCSHMSGATGALCGLSDHKRRLLKIQTKNAI